MSQNICFLNFRKYFLWTQKRVQINHGKLAIGVPVIEVDIINIIIIIIIIAFIASSLTNVHLTRMLTVNVQLTVSHGILWQ